VSHRQNAFTLIELLVVIAVIALLAAILFPVFAQAREKARQTTCLSNLKQIGLAMRMYETDYDERLPDRRDLKTALAGGYRPWAPEWPASDPRGGWAMVIFDPYIKNMSLWSCPSVEGAMAGVPQVEQSPAQEADAASAYRSRYWLWRFDRPDDPIPLDDFWGKTDEQATADLIASGNKTINPIKPSGPAEVEMVMDPYFPRTIPTVPDDLKGRSVHMGGRNRLFLDGHAKWLRDVRTN
jgi:prepilin-type N-terminal cleavage/methylation domain-containing protein/prepilin-type processing-associated H-X9-DG protein